jgi:putative ABC transport system substrate-binding protein
MKRRDFITLLGASAAAWPLAARAQQPAMPVVGYLYVGAPSAYVLTPFRQGLSEVGFVEGRNVAIEYRFAGNEPERLAELAADLVRRRVAVIVTLSSASAALAAKTVTTTIPIVFEMGGDPVQEGLVASLNRPGGNLTGVTSMNREIDAKRLGLVHELLPDAARFAVLANPNNRFSESVIMRLQTAAAVIGRQIEVFFAGTNHEIDKAFASAAQKRVDALLFAADALYGNRRAQLVALAMHHRMPVIYYVRDYVEAGGLMSYGASLADLYRQTGIYTGRVLKGEKPADLPVMQPTKFEFVINLHTAKLFGLTVPPRLLAIADEVIE